MNILRGRCSIRLEPISAQARMLFGRAFERALAAFFLRQDAAAALFEE